MARRVLIGSRLTAAVAMATALITGCGHSTTPGQSAKPPERWPTTLSDLHFVWTAEPGIDLLTQPVVVVRAYIESRTLVRFGGSLDYLYPGFDRAVEPDLPAAVGNPLSTVGRWPEPGGDGKRLVGTDLRHVLRIAQNGRNVTAVACFWTYGAAWQQPDGRYRIGTVHTGPTTALSVERISMLAPADDSADTLPPQKGPSPYPYTDVFGGWRVIGQLQAVGPNGAGPEWPEFPQDQAACAARAPASIERREYLTSAPRPRSDFPTLPSEPGWPVETR
ncbi:hypothetical protein [Mycolicibacterium palauense]|uniref:hypothetical protein n=1 Tax=Mycolicibacterium palauense TaxID=2034511 RepID=UPI000BFEEE5D|nr:hypothetical protein [Mycolicibacterium palauense]